MSARNLLLFFTIVGLLLWLGLHKEAPKPAPASTVLTNQQEQTLKAAKGMQQQLDKSREHEMSDLEGED